MRKLVLNDDSKLVECFLEEKDLQSPLAQSSAGTSGTTPAYNQPYLGSSAGHLPQLEYSGLFIATNISSKVIFQTELILKTNTKIVLVFHAVCWKYSSWSHGLPHPLPFFFFPYKLTLTPNKFKLSLNTIVTFSLWKSKLYYTKFIQIYKLGPHTKHKM